MAQRRQGERRSHPRVPVGISMNIHAKGHRVMKHRGSIADLSIGGMTFRSTAELEEGAALYLKINIPLEIRGEVRHIHAGKKGAMNRYGVRFHKFDFAGAGVDAKRPNTFIAAKFNKS